jgi:hypothetical protein
MIFKGDTWRAFEELADFMSRAHPAIGTPVAWREALTNAQHVTARETERCIRLEMVVRDSIEALERNSTSAPVVECLKAALAHPAIGTPDDAREALKEIVSWKYDCLGERPKPDDETPELTDAFDRGTRMAFFRCAARAEKALAALRPEQDGAKTTQELSQDYKDGLEERCWQFILYDNKKARTTVIAAKEFAAFVLNEISIAALSPGRGAWHDDA